MLGEKEVPEGVLWGIHTARAAESFTLAGRHVHEALVCAYGDVKGACAATNRALGFLGGPKADALEEACREMAAGLLTASTVVDATQNADVFVEVSGTLKACAASLLKVSGDLRLLSSGREAGLRDRRGGGPLGTQRPRGGPHERRRDGGNVRRADEPRGGLPPRLAGGEAVSAAAPRSQRLHIGFFGRRNVGKSSLLNAVTRQAVSIVSETPGTTTDLVEKPMELSPLGPVLFVDTAGVDDEGALGALRIEKTRRALDRADLVVLVVPVDKEAPKGRLVVTDSQAFLKAVADTPPETPLTSFSILFARFQGDLPTLVAGTFAVEELRRGDRVLVAESCTHHPAGEDIGRVKIPRWLRQDTGLPLEPFPAALEAALRLRGEARA